MNMFLVHGKNGIHINRCIPHVDNDSNESRPLNDDDILNNFTLESVWSLDRFVRLCACSLSGNVALVDDRVGLSILYLRNGMHSDLSLDTLRGVGKFKNVYMPLGCKNIKHLHWSDNGTYLVVYFNLSNYSDGGTDNLHIWNITRKNIIGTFNIRRLLPEQWPVVKWIGASNNFALCNNNQISIYSISSTDGVTLKSVRPVLSIPVNRVFSIEVFPQNDADTHLGSNNVGNTKDQDTPNGLINSDAGNTTDLVDAKDSPHLGMSVAGDIVSMVAFIPADVSLHLSGSLRISSFMYTGATVAEINVKSHELKYADSAELLWSPSGRYLMVLAQSMVDMAGEKYGSTMDCLLYTRDGDFYRKVNNTIVHDARWNPRADEFILIQGNMPCTIAVYNIRCEIVYEFPKLYRNTIRWNPLGNMVAFGGFGNLAGEVCFWYNKDNKEMEQIVQFKEPCTVLSSWSSDSRYFMTASTFPRMKVDNFLKIFNCEGHLLINQKLDECYNVYWLYDGNDKEAFIKPRVRRLMQKKAIYRPKGIKKDMSDTKFSLNKDVFSKAPGSPIYVNGTIRDHKLENRNGRLGTLFFNEYGNKFDNASISLLDVFQGVFTQNLDDRSENAQIGNFDSSLEAKSPVNKNISTCTKIKN